MCVCGRTFVNVYVCAEADCGRERRKRIYPRRGKVGSTEPVTKGSSLGEFRIYLEFRRGFAGGPNLP